VRRIFGMVLFLAVLAVPVSAQAPPPALAPAWRPFAEFAPFDGSWSGAATAGARLGGRIARFTMELSGTAFVERTSTIFPAEEGKPEESFEEVGYVTYDREKRKYVAMYFFSTGVFGTYDVEILPDGGLRMNAGALSNYEPGTRSRRVFTRKADGSLDLSLDLAPAGKEFSPFLSGTLKKK
jgi:hypothetical protein